MKVVDENKSIRAIEEIIAYGMVEELIMAAHNELKLLRIMKHWRPWETLFGEDTEDTSLLELINIKADNPFPMPTEPFEKERHDPPKRKPSAGLHPEEEK